MLAFALSVLVWLDSPDGAMNHRGRAAIDDRGLIVGVVRREDDHRLPFGLLTAEVVTTWDFKRYGRIAWTVHAPVK